MPVAAALNGEYGLKDIYVGVPVVIGAGGVEKIVEINMNASEKKMFNNSVGAVKGLIAACKKLDPSLVKKRRAAKPKAKAKAKAKK